jgi:hypothetical protein
MVHWRSGNHEQRQPLAWLHVSCNFGMPSGNVGNATLSLGFHAFLKFPRSLGHFDRKVEKSHKQWKTMLRLHAFAD